MSRLSVSFLADGAELAVPVVPCPFGWGAAQNVITRRVNGTGTVRLPGEPGGHEEDLDLLFPARDYPFLSPGAGTDPYAYVERFSAWCREGKVVRYVAAGAVNAQVLIASVQWREQDGTGDVYARVRLAEYRLLEAVDTEHAADEVSDLTGNTGRTEDREETGLQYYTVQRGDCLSVICRRYYGKSSAAYCNALARYNGIKNPNLIYPGTVLTIPGGAQMGVE